MILIIINKNFIFKKHIFLNSKKIICRVNVKKTDIVKYEKTILVREKWTNVDC